MGRLELVSPEHIQRRAEDIKASLECIYGVVLSIGFEELLSSSLLPTEAFLEKDKLALVLMKIAKEGYDVPIITLSYRENIYILDGHHRAYVLRKLIRNKIKSHVLRFPGDQQYRDIPKMNLKSLPIRDVVPIDDPMMGTWAHANLAKILRGDIPRLLLFQGGRGRVGSPHSDATFCDQKASRLDRRTLSTHNMCPAARQILHLGWSCPVNSCQRDRPKEHTCHGSGSRGRGRLRNRQNHKENESSRLGGHQNPRDRRRLSMKGLGHYALFLKPHFLKVESLLRKLAYGY